jgi:hypothetical protein
MSTNRSTTSPPKDGGGHLIPPDWAHYPSLITGRAY